MWLVNIITHPAALPIIGAGSAWLASKILGARRWAQVRKVARQILGDKAIPIEEPEEAIKRALLEAMRVEILRQTKKLKNGV